MKESIEQQLQRVLLEMVDSGDIKTSLINGEVHYYVEEKGEPSPEAISLPDPLELKRCAEVIKIFGEGDVVFSDSYTNQLAESSFDTTARKYHEKKIKLTKRFNTLL